MEIELERPQPTQEKFLTATSRFIAFGGARGGGKSWAVRTKSILLGGNYSGIKMLLLRKTFPELNENHIIPLRALLKGVATYTDKDKAFQFVNGSRLKLGYLANDGDLDQYQGQEYDVIFLDEATHFTEHMFSVLTACMRGANSFPKRMYLTCNPGGVGHSWVKRLFIDRKYKADENPEDYTFIKSRVYDNKALLEHDKGYVTMLKNLPDDLRRAWLEGDWNVFKGQLFPEFSDDIHVCDPFEIPEHWNIVTSMDYGLDKFAHYHIATDPYKNVYVYKEIHESGLIVSDAVARVKAIETGRERNAIHRRLAPPDLWNTQSITGKSTALLFNENGLSLTRSNNDRVAGWLAVKEIMKVTEELQPDGTSKRTSKLKIFRNCSALIEYLPQLQYDEKKPNDAAAEPHEITHAPDALRYFAIGWTYAPAEPQPQRNREFDWLFNTKQEKNKTKNWSW